MIPETILIKLDKYIAHKELAEMWRVFVEVVDGTEDQLVRAKFMPLADQARDALLKLEDE